MRPCSETEMKTRWSGSGRLGHRALLLVTRSGADVTCRLRMLLCYRRECLQQQGRRSLTWQQQCLPHLNIVTTLPCELNDRHALKMQNVITDSCKRITPEYQPATSERRLRRPQLSQRRNVRIKSSARNDHRSS